MENGAKIGASPSHGEGPFTALLAALQEGLATLSGNLAKAISEASKSVQADLEISYDEEISKYEGEPPVKKREEVRSV